MTTLYIKSMVCNRCIMVVKQELKQQGPASGDSIFGRSTIQEDKLSDTQKTKLDSALLKLGFERIDDRKARLIQTIKNKIIQKIHHTDKVDLKFI